MRHKLIDVPEVLPMMASILWLFWEETIMNFAKASKINLMFVATLAVSTAFSAAGAKAAEFINVLTGGTSGVYYPLGVALVEDLRRQGIEGSRTQVQATKASVENLNLLQQGKGEIAFTLGDSVKLALEGNTEAGFPASSTSCAASPPSIRTTSRSSRSQESGIKTLADLKGKSLSVGAPTSGTELNARADLRRRRPDLRGSRQGRVPALRRIRRADQEPPARRHAAVGGPRRRLDPRPRDLAADHRRRRARPRSSTRSARPIVPVTIPAGTYEGQGRGRAETAAVGNFLDHP